MVRATSFCEDPRTVPVSGMLSEGDATGKTGWEEGREREQEEGERGREIKILIFFHHLCYYYL